VAAGEVEKATGRLRRRRARSNVPVVECVRAHCSRFVVTGEVKKAAGGVKGG